MMASKKKSRKACYAFLVALIALYAVLLALLHHKLSRSSGINVTSSSSGEKASFQAPASQQLPDDLPPHIPLDDLDFVRPSSTYQADPNDIWEDDSTLPPWMKDYFRWHKEQRQGLTESNWKSHRYLIMTCFYASRKCGGTADRLMAVPLMIRVAAQSSRILLIKWGRPAELEEFLLPPTGGLDWRVPAFMLDHLETQGERATVQDYLLEFAPWTNLTVLRTRFQSDDHGSVFYNSRLQQSSNGVWEPSFRRVYHSLWNVLFTPSPPVAQQIETFLETNGLGPGDYTSVHLRALYNVQQRDPRYVKSWVRNAINCASQLTHHGPVYFASDSADATNFAVEYGQEKRLMVVARKDEKEPLHLDKAPDWKKRSPSEYYDTFVDLYLLALSECITYGIGGYGQWASYMSFNSTCAMRHHHFKGSANCEFRKPTQASRLKPIQKPVFRPPLPDKKMETDPNNEIAQVRVDDDDVIFPNVAAALTSSSRLWEGSARLPQWMKDYFAWHGEQRKQCGESNWKSCRYLVMMCLKDNKKCGGTADRLRSTPFLVRLAAETKRLLLIYWEKPASLEAFLLPPLGGVDWRTPEWLSKELARDPINFTKAVRRTVSAAQDPDNVLVRVKLQANDHGSEYYSEQSLAKGEGENAFRRHYHDCWYSMFTPIPSIARKIEDEMEAMHLVPGEYAFAHVRALYQVEDVGRDDALVRNWTRNALNCVSGLRPGGPFFFSSDSDYAKKVAVAYGKERNTSVVTRFDSVPPLHLDKVEDWSSRDPSDFYSVFVDLYIMSLGRCMAFNTGGFAKWAQLLGGRDLTCNVRHWTMGVGKGNAAVEGCTWTDPLPASLQGKEKVTKKLQRPLFLPPMEHNS